MPPSILLIAPESISSPIAEDLRRDLPSVVEAVPNRRSAVNALRRHDFDLILVDESLLASDPTSADLIYQNAGAALVVELTLSISSAARILRLARAGLARQARDLAQCRSAAAITLQHELNSTLAGILLEAQLALREANAEQEPRLRTLVHLATDLRDRLRA